MTGWAAIDWIVVATVLTALVVGLLMIWVAWQRPEANIEPLRLASGLTILVVIAGLSHASKVDAQAVTAITGAIIGYLFSHVSRRDEAEVSRTQPPVLRSDVEEGTA